jgi:hypothetical protein
MLLHEIGNFTRIFPFFVHEFVVTLKTTDGKTLQE